MRQVRSLGSGQFGDNIENLLYSQFNDRLYFYLGKMLWTQFSDSLNKYMDVRIRIEIIDISGGEG